MKSLVAGKDFLSIQSRLETLSSADVALWGRMNVHQMICHLGDAMCIPLGEKVVGEASVGPLQQRFLKWGGLYMPLKWPRDVPTFQEIDQCRLNFPRNDFGSDLQSAITLLSRLRDARFEGRVHPYFGTLTRAEWLRWGWLHADHHLRQFGR
jgi:hypothetical protein